MFQRVGTRAHPGGQITPYHVIMEPTAGALLISTETNMKTAARPPVKCPEYHLQGRRSNVRAIGQHQFGAPNNCTQDKWELKHLLVPTDFSKPSNKALKYAISLAARIGSQITLVHVIKPRPIDSEPYTVWLGLDPREIEANDAMRKLCKKQHVDPALLRQTIVREGTAHREITAAARELEADLIIIATNGRTGFAHILPGSTTEKVVRHAPCPVLVVREKEREFIRDSAGRRHVLKAVHRTSA